MIVYIDNVESRIRFSKVHQHIRKLYPLENPALTPVELWKREFDIDLLYDPTFSGINSLKFRDEKHYAFWLLKWT